MRGAWMALGLVACTKELEDSGPCSGGAADAYVEVGTGNTVFEAVTDGQVVPYVQGPQGGWHVWGSLRMGGLIPGDPEDVSSTDNPIVTFKVQVDGADVGGFDALPRGFSPSGDAFERVGDTLILQITESAQLEGSAAVLTATVTDTCGTTVEDARSVALTFGGPA